MVAAERHLWLTLSDMRDTVTSVADRYQQARQQAAAFQRFLPRRYHSGAAGREQPHPSTSSSYRDTQKQSVASRAPLQRDREAQRRSKSESSKPKINLRAVLQAKKASAKNSLQRAHLAASARVRSGAGGLATSKGVSKTARTVVPCRSSISGHRASHSKNTTGRSRETDSLRMSGSVEASAKRVSVGPAYCTERLQNSVRLSASSQRGSSHTCGPRAGSGHGTRSKRSLEEGGHRGGPSSRQGVQVLQPVVSQIRSEDWFVTIDLKDAYFHISILPQHRKFLRFAFGGEAYQYRVLPFGLALSPRTFTECVDAALAPLRLQGIRILSYIDDWLILAQSEQIAARHRDVVLAHMKELGISLNAKKSVLSPVQRTTYLGVVWDSITMQARLSPARIESILTSVKRVNIGRSLTVKQFQTLLGLMAAASNVMHFGLLYMRPLQWWLRTKGFSPRGNPRASSVRISPDRSAPMSSGESAPGRHFTTASSPVLAGPSMVLGPDFSPQRPSLGNSSQEGSPLTGGGTILHPRPELWKLWRVGDWQAFSVAPSNLDFAPGMAKVFLHPKPGRALKIWRRGHIVPKAFLDTARVPDGERPGLRM
ncbi:hypothetical protein M9458_051819 [Cirrhinus mrigala]|uniref:ribonuclease H n=1 Tax=Cirrhinus mrigala TaxID=683832 RepID=A0ABD0MWD5_CIRMR